MRKWYQGKRSEDHGAERKLRHLSSGLLAVVMVVTIPTLIALAYFTVGITNHGNSITAGSYSLEVSVRDGRDQEIKADQGGTYALPSGAYTVTLTPAGGSTKGYCQITVAGSTYATPQIEKNYTFNIVNHNTTTAQVSFQASWGMATEGMTMIPEKGIVLGQPTAGQGDIPDGNEPSAPAVNEAPQEPAPTPQVTKQPEKTPAPVVTETPAPEEAAEPSPAITDGLGAQESVDPTPESNEAPTLPDM